ncbi:hypothetical protein ColTof3_13890 [Colletotrichum tofieldiae]|nr:hypothetical protein ColTof3_13890 [Colletotrichum tofieldiae]
MNVVWLSASTGTSNPKSLSLADASVRRRKFSSSALPPMLATAPKPFLYSLNRTLPIDIRDGWRRGRGDRLRVVLDDPAQSTEDVVQRLPPRSEALAPLVLAGGQRRGTSGVEGAVGGAGMWRRGRGDGAATRSGEAAVSGAAEGAAQRVVGRRAEGSAA